MVNIGNTWDSILKDDFESDNYKRLRAFLVNEYRTKSILPDSSDIYKALVLTPPEKVKVVLLGQDPYPSKENAMGLAFSVKDNVPLPKSLINIYKEMETDLDVEPLPNGDLTPWAKQGVLLLNSSLTVREGQSASHSNIGWDVITDNIIYKISRFKKHIVFILWGRFARNKKPLISESGEHLILESAHPSPLSATSGFFGSHPFSKTNAFLLSHSESPIIWGKSAN